MLMYINLQYKFMRRKCIVTLKHRTKDLICWENEDIFGRGRGVLFKLAHQ